MRLPFDEQEKINRGTSLNYLHENYLHQISLHPSRETFTKVSRETFTKVVGFPYLRDDNDN